MLNPYHVCNRTFSPELVQSLELLAREDPPPSRNQIAREACSQLAWYQPDGRPALASAKVALGKLQRRGLLQLPPCGSPKPRPHRLRPSGKSLPPIQGLPRRVEQVQGLRLYLIQGDKDPLHPLWNDLIIEQHPCGDAPLVGAQLRYLIASEHGWLGALGFGPAAFKLQCRDQWIGWSTSARLGHLPELIGLARLLIRQEVRCANLVSRVLSVVLERVGEDWLGRYGVRPKLVETFVERAKFTGNSLSASNWLRIGASRGQGRLGPGPGATTSKDVWVYELERQARQKLRVQTPPPLRPLCLHECLKSEDWCQREMAALDLGDRRLNRRAAHILQARWDQPQASFYGSFSSWAPAKAAYGLVEHRGEQVSWTGLLAGHQEATCQRMAAESTVILPQDTTGLNYTGLAQTTGLGPLGEGKGRGLWLHSLLAVRPDGVPLGLLNAQCWARESAPPQDQRGRNAKSIGEKESFRWIQNSHLAAQIAPRMPQTTLVLVNDREGDLYEFFDAASQASPNLLHLTRAQHDRNLASHQKLWAHMAELEPGLRRAIELPRRRGQPARSAEVQVRWAEVEILPPATGCKKSWPSLRVWAVWVREPDPPQKAQALEWMLLSDRPIATAAEAWQRVQWYCRRWTIEEWHRVLKSGCCAEQREFKTAEHLRRALAFDLIVAWRILACVKLGRAHPQLPATTLFSLQELEVLLAVTSKKKGRTAQELQTLTLDQANRLVARLGGYLGRKHEGPPGAESVGIGLRRLIDITWGWRLKGEILY